MFRDKKSELPMGISAWKVHGKKYKYWDYFLQENQKEIYKQARKELLEEVEQICMDTFSGATLKEHKELDIFYKKLEKLLKAEKEL